MLSYFPFFRLFPSKIPFKKHVITQDYNWSLYCLLFLDGPGICKKNEPSLGGPSTSPSSHLPPPPLGNCW